MFPLPIDYLWCYRRYCSTLSVTELSHGCTPLHVTPVDLESLIPKTTKWFNDLSQSEAYLTAVNTVFSKDVASQLKVTTFSTLIIHSVHLLANISLHYLRNRSPARHCHISAYRNRLLLTRSILARLTKRKNLRIELGHRVPVSLCQNGNLPCTSAASVCC